MLPALLLIPLVALLRIVMAWQQVGTGLHAWSWLPGFMPLAAVTLCAGVYLPRRLALVIPLGILLLSDAIVDAHYGAYSFFSLHTLANYVLLALIGLGGMTLRRALLSRPPTLAPVLGAALLSSTFFYAASNTLVWLGAPEYPQTAAGWLQALTVGLPGYLPSYVFFRNGLVSDGLYSMVFVACVRLTLPRGERIRSSSPAVAGPDAGFAEARHQG